MEAGQGGRLLSQPTPYRRPDHVKEELTVSKTTTTRFDTAKTLPVSEPSAPVSAPDAPLVGTVTAAANLPAAPAGSPFARPVPGIIEWPHEEPLNYTEAAVIYALRAARAAETSWHAFDEAEALSVLRERVSDIGAGKAEDRRLIEGYDPEYFPALDKAAHAVVAFLDVYFALEERDRAERRERQSKAQTEGEEA
jgi:hypothetical protein